MKVYLLIESNFNGCDCFESIHSIYSDPDVADFARIAQEEKNADASDWLSFFVREHSVIKTLAGVEL